jgi:hypothetical protein
MRKNGKIQRAVMGILAAMFVASLVLAVASFVWPAPVSAEHYCFWRVFKSCNGDCMCMECYVCCDAYHCWIVDCPSAWWC